MQSPNFGIQIVFRGTNDSMNLKRWIWTPTLSLFQKIQIALAGDPGKHTDPAAN